MKFPCVIKRSGIAPDPSLPVSGNVNPDGLDLAVMRGLQWPNGTVLRVAFLERVAPDLRALIVQHMNAWNRRGTNIRFVESANDPQIRVTLARGQGYWSYQGTDCLHIPKNEPTMALEGMSMRTSAAEMTRVIRHETGHTLGMVHEHLRKEVVDRLDRERVIAYYMRWQGWDRQTVIDNVLTVIPQSALISTRMPELTSIMTYSIPASLTKDGRAIPGGSNITNLDAKFAASIYPVPR